MHGVSREWGIEIDDLLGPDKRRKYAKPRQIAYSIAYGTGKYSTPQIGKYFGGRDPTTIMYGIRRVKRDHAVTDGDRIERVINCIGAAKWK